MIDSLTCGILLFILAGSLHYITSETQDQHIDCMIMDKCIPTIENNTQHTDECVTVQYYVCEKPNYVLLILHVLSYLVFGIGAVMLYKSLVYQSKHKKENSDKKNG